MYAKTWAVNTAASIPFQKNSFEDEKHRNHGSTWGPKLVHTHKHTHTPIQEINNLHKKGQS